ncbi:MAG: hypothetical protein ACYTF7_02545 [Planctomycetota bacterium]
MLSPDGTRLAVIITSPRGLYELWVSDVDRPRLRRLLAIPYTDIMSPVFTPDSDSIVVNTWNPKGDIQYRVLRIPYDNPDDLTVLAEAANEKEAENKLLGNTDEVSGLRNTVLLLTRVQGIKRYSELSLSAGDDPTFLLEGTEIEDLRYAPGQTPLIAYLSTETGRGEIVVRTLMDDELGAPYPVTFNGAWGYFWAVDPEQGLGIRYYTYDQREFFVPISFENNRLTIGDEQPTGRTSRTEYNVARGLPDGRIVAILPGENEKPVTRLELIQNWTATLD